ncbi:TlpA family protein disulfide reductase [Nonlabens antarcticus]|uniref:TlpA family protein disulfide reductase n=1 Tax=Nonlabens antarcticus TaxID=392714 RepID=UPI0018918D4A|nr:TlpA disulfide reductase family protein [Nonlabens antarcticus]
MKKSVFILILFSFFKAPAQEMKVVYKQSDGKLMTESEYISMRDGFEERMKREGKAGEIKEVIVDSITKKILYKNFDLGFVSVTTNEIEHIDSYLKKKLPFTELQLLNSNKIKLSDLEGKPTLLSFWFIGCVPCIKELPALESLKKKYGSKVNFVAITFNKKEQVKLFLAKRDFTYEHIVDAQKFVDEIGINTYPRNIILDKKGNVQIINGSIPSTTMTVNKKQELKFDLSEYETQLNNLL